MTEWPETEEYKNAQDRIAHHLGRLEPGDPMRERVATLFAEWNEISQELSELYGTGEPKEEQGEHDWCDYPSDAALKDRLFWWTWGN